MHIDFVRLEAQADRVNKCIPTVLNIRSDAVFLGSNTHASACQLRHQWIASLVVSPPGQGIICWVRLFLQVVSRFGVCTDSEGNRGSVLNSSLLEEIP